MKTADFIREHDACREGAKWALSISEDMADVWDALFEQDKYDWLMWMLSQPSVLPDSTSRRLACRFVRETPLADGRKVWDLLTDERSRRAVEVAERYVESKATTDELAAAAAAAWAADAAAYADAHTACAAAADTTYSDAARAAAWAAADAGSDVAWAARSAADAAAWAAYDSAYASACDAYDAHAAAEAAKSAQITMIAQLRNPFKEGEANEDHCFFVGTSCPY